MTISKVYSKLRKNSRGQYILLSFCTFLSVLLITSFSLMYFGPTVQSFLPEGGDTRKMANLLISATAIGCFIFTVYASSLFFRYKSREYGILMALGMQKKHLRTLLFKELSLITAISSLLGLLCSVPVSYFIWKLFELFIISNRQMTYRFGAAGFLPGVLFAVLLALMLSFCGRKFIKRSDIMDILRTQHKSEMIKEIKGWTMPLGIVLILLGIFLGNVLPQIAAKVFSISLPALVNGFYMLSLVGIYLVMLNIVAQNKLKKNKKRYYKNLVSVSLMRFTAKQTTRSMCVIVLMLFICCFSSFYGILYATPQNTLKENGGKAFSLHYPAAENQINRKDIEGTAARRSQEIHDYSENSAANLVISYLHKDFSEDGSRYVDIYSENAKCGLFVSEKDFADMSGQNIDVKRGTYKTVLAKDAVPSFFDYEDGVDKITNPTTDISIEVSCGGTVEFTALASMATPFAYVLDNADYRAMTKGLPAEYQEKMVFFNVSDIENSYVFAKDLLTQYINSAGAVSDHMANWDIWEEKQAEKAGKGYSYSGSINITAENNMLLGDWKYAPRFSIIDTQDMMQLISVYVMLCLYIFIIALTAISVMTYVRSISIAADNRSLFESLDKLGADRSYKEQVLKKQLSKIFQYPAVIGCGIGLLFSSVMAYSNDGRIFGSECTALIVLLAVILLIAAIMACVYKIAMKKAKKIVQI